MTKEEAIELLREYTSRMIRVPDGKRAPKVLRRSAFKIIEGLSGSRPNERDVDRAICEEA